MTRRTSHALVALLGAAASACGSSAGTPTIGLSEPSAVAVFRGYTTKNADLHPYLAIASAGKDELVLVDALDDKPVLAPVLIHALAVPVGAPRPATLVSGSLGDARADLLVAISAGSTALQVVQTWTTAGAPDVRVRTDAALARDLADVAPGAAILAAVSAPVPELGASGWAPAAGRVRVVAALSGGRLAVVEYTRDPAADGGLLAGTPVVQALGFDALSLAVNPADPRFVYAATVDPIPTATGTVQGVAELDATGAPGAWTFRGLDARGPTTLVAASRLAERKPDSALDDENAFQRDGAGNLLLVDRVYAALDGASCGDRYRVPCGVAVLDPVTGKMPPDPAGLMPYLAPISVPASPLGIGVSLPPAQPMAADLPLTGAPFMRISPASGQRTTTGVAALPSADGNVYYIDLARWAVPNDVSMLRNGAAGTAVASATAFVLGTSLQQLGLWYTPAPTVNVPHPDPKLGLGTSELPFGVKLTPGFTPSETWSVIWQGILPGLDLQRAVTADNGDGRPWLALQVPLVPGGSDVTRVVRLYDPALGVHLDDIVVLSTAGLPPACTGPANAPIGSVEARIAALLPPDAQRPGGAVVLDPPPCVPAPTQADPAAVDCTDQAAYEACLPTLLAGVGTRADGPLPIVARVRASELVLAGAGLGYVGRPALAASGTDPAFELRYDQDEDTIACPLIPWPWPDPFPASPPAVPACDAACRDQCEHLLRVRKARRIYHVSDACRPADPTDNVCNARWPGLPFPQANGAAITFRVGLHQDAAAATAPIQRDLSLTFTTRSGLSLSFRRPPSTTASSVLPVGVAAFDRSPYTPAASYRFLVPYVDGHVLDFSPAEFFNSSVVIR